MGQLYSHLVFRPPSVCSYQSADGFLQYVVPDDGGIPRVHRTRLIWLHNALQVRIPCAWVRQSSAEFVVLYAHQNAEDLGSSICHAHMLSHALGVDVLAFEYSGYGLSEKSERAAKRVSAGRAVAPSMLHRDRQRVEPSEKACCSDIDAAFKYLTAHCKIDPMKIILFGRSIGSGPAVHCAATRKVGGLVLIAPIASAVRVPLKKLNVTLPFIDTFPNIDRASKIQCPVLVVHGDMDELVPKLHGERLFEKIKRNGNAVKPLWIPDAKHNNVVEDFQSIVFSRYLKFLEELKTSTSAREPSTSCPRKEASRPYPSRNLFKKSRRPRVAAHLPCLYAARESLENLSTVAHVGDDDRRSRDIRGRSYSNNRLHEGVSFYDTLADTDSVKSRRYCGLVMTRIDNSLRLGNTESVLNAFCFKPDNRSAQSNTMRKLSSGHVVDLAAVRSAPIFCSTPSTACSGSQRTSAMSPEERCARALPGPSALPESVTLDYDDALAGQPRRQLSLTDECCSRYQRNRAVDKQLTDRRASSRFTGYK